MFWSRKLTLSLLGGAATATLGSLTLSSTSFTTGIPSSGTINGATVGSAITSSGLPTGFTINSSARTWAWDGTGSVSTGSLTLIETLAGAIGSPKSTAISYAITAIPTPTLTNVSATGTVPLTLAGAVASNGYAGMYIQWEFAATLTPSKNPDGSYVTTSQADVTFVDGASWSNEDLTTGWTDPSGPFSVHWRGLINDEAGTITLTDSFGDTATYTAITGWSNDYTDTINVSAAVLTNAVGTSCSKYLNIPSSYQAVVNANVNGIIMSRATLSATNTKFWIEQHIDGFHTGNDGALYFALLDNSVDLNNAGGGTIAALPGTSSPGFTVAAAPGGQLTFLYNGGSHPQTLPGGNVCTVGDSIGIAYDTSGHGVQVFYHSAANGDLGQVGTTVTLTSEIPSPCYAASAGRRGTGTVSTSDASTLHIKSSDWVMTPPTGYNFYYA